MRRANLSYLGIVLVVGICAARANAASIGYFEAVGELGRTCGQDIQRLCPKESLGGGAVQKCLFRNQARISPGCKASMATVSSLLETRAAARASVMQVCAADIQRLCAGVQQGDGNLMECFYKARRNVNAACRRAVEDAGYDVALGSGAVSSQVQLDSQDILGSLQGVENATNEISAASLRQMAARSLTDPARSQRTGRPPLSEQLSQLAQITIAIRFDYDSSRIRPDSFGAVGLMADALYHPYLQGYCFLIVGHADGTGNREYNLKLSQQRADAVRAALINPFGISAARIEAVGLGEEQLLNAANPAAAENRRVQLINIGQLTNNRECPHP